METVLIEFLWVTLGVFIGWSIHWFEKRAYVRFWIVARKMQDIWEPMSGAYQDFESADRGRLMVQNLHPDRDYFVLTYELTAGKVVE